LVGRLGVGGAGGGVVAFQEGGEFFAEEFPGGLVGQEDVIGAGERDKLSAGNFGGEDAAFFGRSDAVAVRVKDDGGGGDFGRREDER